jgi:hypothetical protein
MRETAWGSKLRSVDDDPQGADMKTPLFRLGHFVLHYLEMCMAMCAGGIALNVAFFGALALLGATYSEDQLPTFALLAVGANLAIAMAAWMRFRKHEWRPTMEMASTSIILVVGVIAAAAIGLIDEGDRLAAITTLACPVMLVPMALRWDLYASSHGMHGRSITTA